MSVAEKHIQYNDKMHCTVWLSLHSITDTVYNVRISLKTDTHMCNIITITTDVYSTTRMLYDPELNLTR